MSLEDFFTLNEMKDGLSNTSRVEELISVLRKHEDGAGNNALDAARQQLVVARVLVATEDKHILVNFLELDGLVYLNQWLQDALKYMSEANDETVLELINSLLKTFQKLPVNIARLAQVGVSETVKEVLHVRNSDACDTANMLLALWEVAKVDEKFGQDPGEMNGDETEGGNVTCPMDSVSKESSSDLSGAGQSAEKDTSLAEAEKSPGASEVDINKNSIFSVQYNRSPHDLTSAETSTVSGDANSSVLSNHSDSCQEKQQTAEDRSVFPDTTGSNMVSRPESEERQFSEVPDVILVVMDEDVSPYKPTVPSPVHSPVILKPSSGCTQKSEMNGSRTMETEHFGDNLSCEKPIHKSSLKTAGSENSEDTSDDSSMENVGNSPVQHVMEVDSVGPGRLVKQSEKNITVDMCTESEGNFEFGDDALEYAVLVAIEAKEEVADREQCSSSHKDMSDGKVKNSDSSELGEDFAESKGGEFPLADEASPDKNISEELIDNNDAGVLVHDVESDPLTSCGQDSTYLEENVHTSKKRKCNFDLNDALCSLDVDESQISCFSTSHHLSAPVAVVAISKGPPILPTAPLHFQGKLEWRGPASTSAFRPASPRITCADKSVPAPDQKSDLWKIDLNIVEGEDGIETGFALKEQVLAFSSALLPENSSISSGKGEKRKLDLNQLAAEDYLPYRSASDMLSISSASQHSVGDIDLNENPASLDSASPLASGRYLNDAGEHKEAGLDGPAITLMGSRFSIDRKEPISRDIYPAVVHGSSAWDSGPPRSSGAFLHSGLHLHGYGELEARQNQYLSPPLYEDGFLPCMVDMRGTATAAGQFAGSMDLTGLAAPRPPLPGNVVNAPLGSFTFGNIQPGLDMNSRVSTLDSGIWERGRLGQSFLRARPPLVPGTYEWNI